MQCRDTSIFRLLVYAETVIFVGFLDNTKLFCPSRDYIDVIQQRESAYCTITGVVYLYSTVQFTTWAMLHAVFLFWGVAFPFSFRQLKDSGRIRYAHIISVVLAVVLPLPGPLIQLKDGYAPGGPPSFLCFARNQDIYFYTFILPVSVIIGITSCLLVLILWIIFKEFVLKKLLARKKTGNVGKAQIKITAVIMYYTLQGVTGLVTLAYFIANRSDAGQSTLAEYITCGNKGLPDCALIFGSTDAVHIFAVISTVMLSFVPLLALLFNCDLQSWRRKGRGRSTTTGTHPTK